MPKQCFSLYPVHVILSQKKFKIFADNKNSINRIIYHRLICYARLPTWTFPKRDDKHSCCSTLHVFKWPWAIKYSSKYFPSVAYHREAFLTLRGSFDGHINWLPRRSSPSLPKSDKETAPHTTGEKKERFFLCFSLRSQYKHKRKN
jgi:hypothetical protein